MQPEFSTCFAWAATTHACCTCNSQQCAITNSKWDAWSFSTSVLSSHDDCNQCIVQNAAALRFERASILETTGNTPWLNKTHGRRSMHQIWNHNFAKGVTSLGDFANHCTLVVAASMPHVKKCNSQRSLVLNSHIAPFKGTSLKFAFTCSTVNCLILPIFVSSNYSWL